MILRSLPLIVPLIVLCTLLPISVQGQTPGDTVSVVVPEDRNCSDFVSQQDAQGWYDAMQIITGEDDAHRLDSDGDGQPCESISVAKKEWFSPDSAAADTLALSEGEELWIEYELRPARVACGGVPETFRVDDFLDQTRYSVDNWNTGYLEYINKAECIHMIGVLKDAQ